MKKTIKPLVLLLVIGLLSYLGYGIITKMSYKNEVAVTLQTIPEFHFKTLENKRYTKGNLKPNTSTIFIYFNTECNFCQHEAQSIKENLENFKNIQLVFVSTEPIETIKSFASTHNLLNQQNITFLYDSTNHFSNRFDANSYPYVLIYNSNQELVKKHKGQLKAETIINLLK